MLSKLIERRTILFSQGHPQVLMHAYFSITSFQIDENEYGTTGIAD